VTATTAAAPSAASIPHGAHNGPSGWRHDLEPHASAAGVVIISTLATWVITMAWLSVAIVAAEFGAGMAFGVVMDLIEIPAFARLRISCKPNSH